MTCVVIPTLQHKPIHYSGLKVAHTKGLGLPVVIELKGEVKNITFSCSTSCCFFASTSSSSFHLFPFPIQLFGTVNTQLEGLAIAGSREN